ncbi:YdiU family protein [Marinospirillum sp. MEB164]|uniref:Protein nucleotidyltransferase YdiU n=1 Tax=Marinospirillum alkalitolerans TaxID=3123374 RepID=A0ABW8PXP9_9GAMM
MSFFNAWKVTPRYTQLGSLFYQPHQPEVFPGPSQLVALSTDAARLIDLDPCTLDEKALLDWMSGRLRLEGSQPIAMKYAGHQFGQFNPALGDGRGLLMVELTNQLGQPWEVHLKGAGQTTYSRFGDGRAVLRSSIREFLGSEALHHLGIPTTRALAVATTGESVRREIYEPGATLLRLTPSHLRFGHFEHAYIQQDLSGLHQLADYALQHYFPEQLEAEAPYAQLFAEVVARTARLGALWQAYGFCHGVLNTDNMSLLGETLDYGPFAFLDHYQPQITFNHSDPQGRYAFDRQPSILHWNLVRLAQAFSPLVDTELLNQQLALFMPQLEQAYYQCLAQRLGVDAQADRRLIEDFLALCRSDEIDWTDFLRRLAEGDTAQALSLTSQSAAWRMWLVEWQQAVQAQYPDAEARQAALCQYNPCIVPRTHLLQAAIEAAELGDFSQVRRLHALLRRPFNSEGVQKTDRQAPPKGWPVALSCSS